MNSKQWVFTNGEWFDTLNMLPAKSLDQDGYNDSFELILGVCGCIADVVADTIYKYLTDVDYTDFDAMTAAMADTLGFTEHGGSVRSAWLTEAGKAWMRLYEKAQPRDSSTT